MSAMNAPFVIPMTIAARNRSMAFPSRDQIRAGTGLASGYPPRFCTTAMKSLLDRQLLIEGPCASLGHGAGELRQGGVAVGVERPLAEHAVVVLRAHHVREDRRAVVRFVACLCDRGEDNLGRLVAVDRVRVRALVLVLGVVRLEPDARLAGVLLRRDSTEGLVHALAGRTGLPQELRAVDAVAGHEIDRPGPSFEVLHQDRRAVVDDAAVVDEVGTAVLDLVR